MYFISKIHCHIKFLSSFFFGFKISQQCREPSLADKIIGCMTHKSFLSLNINVLKLNKSYW